MASLYYVTGCSPNFTNLVSNLSQKQCAVLPTSTIKTSCRATKHMPQHTSINMAGMSIII